MRIFVLHSRYRSGAMSGENRVVDDEIELLQEAGHDVASWTPSVPDQVGRIRSAANVVWSSGEMANVRRILADHHPDVVHIHSLYPQLSPAVIRVAADTGVRVVMTLHNFRLMCLPATFLREGQTCEACAGRSPWRGIAHACYRDSRSASAALATSLTLHRKMRTFEQVRLFLAVSEFVRGRYVQYGFESQRIRVKENFSRALPTRQGPGGAFLFLGRLSPEKGAQIAIDATPRSARLRLVGDGPERSRLESFASQNVIFEGGIAPELVPLYLSAARALVVPSQWYEGAPRVIIEAFAAGVPVVASRIGGLGELVMDDVNGILVDPADRAGWRAALDRLRDDDESARLGRGAYETWQQRYSPGRAIAQLEGAYEAALAE